MSQMNQDEYIAILFDDNAFTGQQRRDFLGSRFGGRRYSDELTVAEKSGLIEDLKARKCKPLPVEDDEDEDADQTAKQRAARRGRSRAL